MKTISTPWVVVTLSAVLLGGSVSAFANLGETLNQITARYGKPVNRLPDYMEGGMAVSVYRYEFNGQKILVEFVDGKCTGENIWAPRSSPNFSEKACLEMAMQISGQTNWIKFSFDKNEGYWSATNVRATLERFPDFGLPDTLHVFTVDFGQYGQPSKKETNIASADSRKNNANAKADAAARVLKWHQDLANAGDPFGECQMGLRYRDGNGVPRDLAKAREWLAKAAEHGDTDAVSLLARLPPPTASGPTTNSVNVSIRSAEFGAGKNVVDVTERVRQLLRGPDDSFIADAKTLGADPLPGKKKQLIIRYDFGGSSGIMTVPGASSVSYRSLERNAGR